VLKIKHGMCRNGPITIASTQEADRLQIIDIVMNRLLLKPATGVTVTKLTIVMSGRVDNLMD